MSMIFSISRLWNRSIYFKKCSSQLRIIRNVDNHVPQNDAKIVFSEASCLHVVIVDFDTVACLPSCFSVLPLYCLLVARVAQEKKSGKRNLRIANLDCFRTRLLPNIFMIRNLPQGEVLCVFGSKHLFQCSGCARKKQSWIIWNYVTGRRFKNYNCASTFCF